ncbi:hypothetical protein [Streptomyces sp. IBSBF 2806]|uniref:Orn/Lys/Arg family decarboxylase n=1 Tax=Streptomyces sp. IBSBF 2806 TaxID=2903529 RepID=UPI002FDBC8E4
MAAATVTVTPPGVPVPVPGEGVGGPDGPLPCRLGALEPFDRRFPGFRSETHGVTLAPDAGGCPIECLRPTADHPTGPDADADGRHTAPPVPRGQPTEGPALVGR